MSQQVIDTGELRVTVNGYTLLINKRCKRRVYPGARGWLALGPARNGQVRPTVAYGVIDGAKVRVKGGGLLPSVMRKLVEVARAPWLERGVSQS
jgi:hypothetical protein